MGHYQWNGLYCQWQSTLFCTCFSSVAFIFFSSVHIGAILVYRSPHLIFFRVQSLCFPVVACLAGCLLLFLYLPNWQSNPLSCSLSALSSFLSFFFLVSATVYLHNHLLISSFCFPLPPSPFQIYILFFWYATWIIVDDKVYQQSPWW